MNQGDELEKTCRRNSDGSLELEISHVLLDIEGTTCPVSFVAETLFPYARAAMTGYLRQHANDRKIKFLVNELMEVWQREATENKDVSDMEIDQYIQWLIDNDRKLAPLKELQGLIWEEGYFKGDLKAPLFDEVAATLEQWQQQGIILAVYSSGSVMAQQLLYRYSTHGDLTSLFSHWFDTRTGSKKEASSYRRIAEAMNVSPGMVVFISDSRQELEAAQAAGMKVVFSDRDGNPEPCPEGAGRICRLKDIALKVAAGCRWGSGSFER